MDISVPRNVHPDCSSVSGAHCFNVDDLKLVVRLFFHVQYEMGRTNYSWVSVYKVERNTAKRRREMIEAEHILREELERFRLWQQSLGKSLHTRSVLTTFRAHSCYCKVRFQPLRSCKKRLKPCDWKK